MIIGLFIGIDRHSDSHVADLNGAVRDAKALWAVLSDSIGGMTATLLTDAAASLIAVTQALDDTLGAAGSDDVLLISFAGHGTPDHRLVAKDAAPTTSGLPARAGAHQWTPKNGAGAGTVPDAHDPSKHHAPSMHRGHERG